jgi:hypothetical protein
MTVKINFDCHNTTLPDCKAYTNGKMNKRQHNNISLQTLFQSYEVRLIPSCSLYYGLDSARFRAQGMTFPN